MIARLQSKLSYANVISTLALFVALGGTSYAALTLPRNSVGSSQIRARAVGSSELRSRAVSSRHIRDRSIALRDISTTARGALRGATGPQGAKGESGPRAAAYRAAVNSGGVSVRGNATVTHDGATNEYRVGFAASVKDCVSTATLARVEGGATVDPPPGRITVAHEGDRVLVRTFGTDGSPTALPFDLVVAC